MKRGIVLGVLILSWCGATFAAGEDWITLRESNEGEYSYKTNSFQVVEKSHQKYAMITASRRDKLTGKTDLFMNAVDISQCASEQGLIQFLYIDGRPSGNAPFTFGAENIGSFMAEYLCARYAAIKLPQKEVPEQKSGLDQIRKQHPEAFADKPPIKMQQTDVFSPPGRVQRARLPEPEDFLVDPFAMREEERKQASLKAAEAKWEEERKAEEKWMLSILVVLCLLGIILLDASFIKSKRQKSKSTG